MPKQPQVQGKVQGKLVQQAQAQRPLKDLPPLALAALGEYLSRHPAWTELELAARTLTKEHLHSALTTTDDPGNWLEERLRKACTPEEWNAAGAHPQVNETTHQRPYADLVSATQNAMRSAVALVTPQVHGFAAIGKLELDSGWAQLLLAGAQLQTALWVAQPDLKQYLVRAILTEFGDKDRFAALIESSGLLPRKCMVMYQHELRQGRENAPHKRAPVLDPPEVGLVVPIIEGLPKARQAELAADVLTGLLVPEAGLPPDTLWHWAAYQQLLQFGLMAPMAEAAAARKSDVAVAWQVVAREVAASKEKDQQKTVSQAVRALRESVNSLLKHSQERHKLSAACAQMHAQHLRLSSSQAAAGAEGQLGPGAASISSDSASAGRRQPPANGQRAAACSSNELYHKLGLGVQEQEVLLPAIKAFVRASAGDAGQEGRRGQQQQLQPPLHALLVINGLVAGQATANDVLVAIEQLLPPPPADTAAAVATCGTSSSCPGSPEAEPPGSPSGTAATEEWDCPGPALCWASKRLSRHCTAAGEALAAAVWDAATGQPRELTQQEALSLLMAVLSPCSPEQLLAAAGVGVGALQEPPPGEGCPVCAGCLSAGQRAHLDALVDAHLASARMAEVIDMLAACLLSQRLADTQQVLAQQKAAAIQHQHHEQQHQLGCMLELCNQARELELRCDLQAAYGVRYEDYIRSALAAVDNSSGGNSPGDSPSGRQGAAASSSSSKPGPKAAAGRQPVSAAPTRGASSGGHHVRFSSPHRCGSTGSRSRRSSAAGSPTAAAMAAAAERPGPSLRVAALRAAASGASAVERPPGLGPNLSSSSSSARAPPGRRKRIAVVEAAESGRGERQGNGSAGPFSPRSDASFHTASDDDSASDGEHTPVAAASRAPATSNRMQVELAVAAAQQLGHQQWTATARDLCGMLLKLDAAATALQHSLVHPEAASSTQSDSSSRQEGQHSASPSTWGSLGSLGSMLGGWMGAKAASNSSNRPLESAGPRLPKQRGQEQREAWEQQQQQWRTALWRRYGEVRQSGRLRFDSYFPGAGPEVDKHPFWMLAAAVLRSDMRHVAAHRLSEDLLSFGARLEAEEGLMDTGSEEGFASFCAALEPPLQDYCRPPERQLDAPLGGLEIQAVQLLRAAWRDTSLQASAAGPSGMAFLAATSVLRLQVLLGQLCTQFTPVTFPWHTLGRSSGIRSFDSARLLERAREATAGPGLLAAEDELRLLVRSLLGLTEYLDGQSSKIKDTSKTVSDYVKSRRSSSSVEQELGAFEWQPSAYGRTVMGDYPAAMFTICQAWLLLQLRKRGLAGGDLGGRLQAVDSAMDSLSWLHTYNSATGPKPVGGYVDLLHLAHREVVEGLRKLVTAWASRPEYPLVVGFSMDGHPGAPSCDTCGKHISGAPPETLCEEERQAVEAGEAGPLLCEGCGVARWCSPACAQRARHGGFCWEVLSRSLLYNTSKAAPDAHLRALQQGRPRLVPLWGTGQGSVFGGAPAAEVMASSHRAPGNLPDTVYLPTHHMCPCNPPQLQCSIGWVNATVEKWRLVFNEAEAATRFEQEGAAAAAAAAGAGQGIDDMLQQLGDLGSWRRVENVGRMNELD